MPSVLNGPPPAACDRRSFPVTSRAFATGLGSPGIVGFLAAALGILLPGPATAAVTAPLFQSHMVLQRQMPVPVFGAASPGEVVTVAFRGQTQSAQAGADGRWRVTLDPMEAGGPFTLTLQGANTLTLTDVLVGEVWLASGQSNMARTLSGSGGP